MSSGFWEKIAAVAELVCIDIVAMRGSLTSRMWFSFIGVQSIHVASLGVVDFTILDNVDAGWVLSDADDPNLSGRKHRDCCH